MFSMRHGRIKLVYAGLGSLFTIIGIMLPPVTAQLDRFVEIECSELRVVDEKRNTRATLRTDEHGGRFEVYDRDGRLAVVLGVDEHGGYFDAYGKDGKSRAILGFDKHGGRVQLDGRGKGKVILGMDGNGRGGLWTWNKNGYRSEAR